MGTNFGKNLSKNVSSKYSQKVLDHAKQSATDAIKTASKRAIEKTAETTGDLIGNKIADKITKVSKTSPKNNSEKNIEHDREIHRERYLQNKIEKYWWSKINIIIIYNNDVYIYVKGTLTVPNTGTAAAPYNNNKKVIFKNCDPFINCIGEINNAHVDDVYDTDVVMPLYNLIEYSDTFLKHQEVYINNEEMDQL